MINQLIKVLSLFLALAAIILGAHYFRYEVVADDNDRAAFIVFDRLTGKAQGCLIENYYSRIECYGFESITK